MKHSSKQMELRQESITQSRIWSQPVHKFFAVILIAVVTLNVVNSVILPVTVPISLQSTSKLHFFQNGAVSSDAKLCSEVGTKIMLDGGNVADAAIATLFCNGIATMQSLGIGGSFTMNMLISGKAYTLDARDVAPLNLKSEDFKTSEEYLNGRLAIATPGEVRGYWELHKRFGSMKWKNLIQPTIDLCENGMEFTEHMRYALMDQHNPVTDTYLKRMFVDSETGEVHPAGTHIHPVKQLCDTYRMIAENGGDDFYTGRLADLIAEDLKNAGSVITKQDLSEYKAIWRDTIAIKLDNRKMYVTPAPSGGGIMALIINTLKGYEFTADSIASDKNTILTYHRILEAFKFAYGQRTKIGDPAFINVTELYKNITSSAYADEIRQKIDDRKAYTDPIHYGAEDQSANDRGTSHISILAPNGDAIAVTSSINNYFGCGISGKRTGILFNTGVSDFGIPPFKDFFNISAAPANYLKPQKRALSSMCPAIITDKNNQVEMVVGAAGGSRIITGVAWTILRTLWFGQDLKEAIDSLRINHQLEPMIAEHELGMSQSVLDGLNALGHPTEPFHAKGAIVNAIYRNSTGIYANADFRKKGDAAGF